MPIRFYLHSKPNKAGERLIYCSYTHKGTGVWAFSTGVRIPPQFWNKERQRVKRTYAQAETINNQILLPILRKLEETALRQGWSENSKFQFLKSSRIEGKHIALSDEDLHKIRNVDLKNERLCRVRDLFLFQCATGLRVSDLQRLRPENVQDKKLSFYQHKGRQSRKTLVQLSLPDEARAIWDKYEGELPVISEQKYRDYIKEVCSLAGLTEAVTTSRGTMPKYKAVGTHTARRTCATRLYRAGVHLTTIQKVLGHANAAQTEKYIRSSRDDFSDALLNL